MGQERAKIKPEIIVRGTPRSIVFDDYEIMLLRFRGISLQCALATRSSSTYIQRSAGASTLRVLHAFTYLYGGARRAERASAADALSQSTESERERGLHRALQSFSGVLNCRRC